MHLDCDCPVELITITTTLGLLVSVTLLYNVMYDLEKKMAAMLSLRLAYTAPLNIVRLR